jgi:protein SCO1/2
MQARHYLILGIAILIGLVTTAGLLRATQGHTFQGSYVEDPVPAANFELADQNGAPFRLDDQEGKIVLLFFGYTHCPDVCPTTLSDFGKVRAELGEDADQVEFVFITTDPQRDNPEQIKRYLTNFDAGIHGLTGVEQDLEKVWKAFGVYREIAGQGDSENYLVDHTSRIYLIDQEGNLRLTYTFGTASKGISDDISYLLQAN